MDLVQKMKLKEQLQNSFKHKYDSESHPPKPRRLKSKKSRLAVKKVMNQLKIKNEKIQKLNESIKDLSDTSHIKRILVEVQSLARTTNIFELVYQTAKIRADFLFTIGKWVLIIFRWEGIQHGNAYLWFSQNLQYDDE